MTATTKLEQIAAVIGSDDVPATLATLRAQGASLKQLCDALGELGVTVDKSTVSKWIRSVCVECGRSARPSVDGGICDSCRGDTIPDVEEDWYRGGDVR